MTVRELLKAWEDHEFTDVIISDSTINTDMNDLVDDTVAYYKHRLHNDWYCGQLSYLSEHDMHCNELAPYLEREVKSFTAINTFEIDHTPCIYITIK